MSDVKAEPDMHNTREEKDTALGYTLFRRGFWNLTGRTQENLEVNDRVLGTTAEQEMNLHYTQPVMSGQVTAGIMDPSRIYTVIGGFKSNSQF